MKLSRVSEEVTALKLQAKITKRRIVDFLGKLRYIVLGVALGGSWMFVYIQVAPDVKEMFSDKRIVAESPFVHPAKAKEIEKPSRTEAIADIIHNLESSRGKNNYSKCEEQGVILTGQSRPSQARVVLGRWRSRTTLMALLPRSR
jgi:hypothetical protein